MPKKILSQAEKNVVSSLRDAANESRKADELAEKAHMALAGAQRVLETLKTRSGLSEDGAKVEEDITELLRVLGGVRQELADVVWKVEKYANKIG